jgi:exodeoxyribonuclease VII large subunit
VVPDRADLLAAIGGGGRRLDAAVTRQVAAAARTMGEERRALERLHPAAQLAVARERTGLLVDRATRSIATRLDAERRSLERAGVRLGPTLPSRLARDRTRLSRADGLGGLAARRVAGARAGLEAAAAALAVLGPQATLDRGYAIVRRAPDGAIVRAPAEAPTGTGLAIRLAGGELAATVAAGTNTGSAAGEPARNERP